MPLIGVAGGSGSGKTTLAQKLHQHFGPKRSVIVFQDSYYFDRSQHFHGDGSLNFDHPSALDWQLMIEHMQNIKKGVEIDIPIYDFATHTRSSKTQRVEPTDIILVDGILIFHPPKLRNLFDLRVFVDCPEPIRYERRLRRDVEERGRKPEGVRIQYQSTVLPMHNEFVEPSKAFADRIVDGVSDLSAHVTELAKSF